jgi:hypothetical protein
MTQHTPPVLLPTVQPLLNTATEAHLGWTTQKQVHKSTIINRQLTLPMHIPLPERFRKMLDRHTSHQEPIKRHPSRPGLVACLWRRVPFLEFTDEVRREWIAERGERLF